MAEKVRSEAQRADDRRRSRENQLQRQLFVDKIQWLVADGRTATEIALDIGSSRQAIERRLYRAGRFDLARYFGNARGRYNGSHA